ncbi:glycosyltransferase family 39 protein [Candidatus Microgenomates bacterium]|nr:glycosyltransferase family 39 protein [Candidatus Microgenomates bacterium]
MKKIISFLRPNFVLILILSLFLFSRLFRISEIPGSLYWDEASIGYNAYSVLTTGKDEWGEVLPLHFRAFGEFKLPVYVYSVVVSEAIFGLTAFAVRLPSVIYGFFSVLGLYLLVMNLTKSKTISLLSSFLFTITPWFLIFSRTGYEAVAGLAFFLWAIFFWLQSDHKKWLIIPSVIFFLASSYSYNSFRILTPLFLGPILISFAFSTRKKKSKKNELLLLLFSAFLILASLIPIYKLYSQDSGLSRLQTVGTTKNLVSNYFKNYSPDFLFVNGDTNPRSQVPGSPQLYLLDSVFILLGLIYIFKRKDFKILYILIALILAPIPAAITRESPHALRVIFLSPVLVTISAMGIYFLLKRFKSQKRLVMVVVIALYLLSFEGYFYKFGTIYNDLSSSAWQSEYKQIFESSEGGCVSDEYAQPYIFALFYNRVNSNDFISTKVLNDVSDWGFSTVASFGNYTFPKSCENF